MYVCVCHAVTDRQIREIARESGASVGAVYRMLGVAPQCGKCALGVREIVKSLHRSAQAASEQLEAASSH